MVAFTMDAGAAGAALCAFTTDLEGLEDPIAVAEEEEEAEEWVTAGAARVRGLAYEVAGCGMEETPTGMFMT